MAGQKPLEPMDRVNIMQEQWDYLIILDACRYDYFERVWKDYLQGQLEKRISIGSSTKEWRNKTFTGYYDDVVYISANPFINSLHPVNGFLGADHFWKVYDLWQDDWDEQRGTVLPGKVTERAIDIVKRSSNKRTIIHYIQPHEPYLGVDMADGIQDRFRPIVGKISERLDQKQTKTAIVERTLRIIKGVLYWMGFRGHLVFWRLRELLNMPPANHMDAIRRKYGNEALRKAYKENLQIALKHVAKLVDALSGRVVVTSDHGEALGENNNYEHWSRASDPLLLEVPWLVIDKGRKVTAEQDQKQQAEPVSAEDQKREVDEETKKQIQQRLRALGYFD